MHVYKLAARGQKETTQVRVGNGRIGAGDFTFIAGPCAVESRAQLFSSARAVASVPGAILRGGLFKTRTSPYDFQGLGNEGIAYINEARAQLRLPAVVEALCEEHVHALKEHVDMIQIGARNMQNVPLLRSAGRSGVPVLVKRGASATLGELLMAAEYVLLEGNPNVVLCERGIRGFDPETRYVFDLGGALRLKEMTHLPVIVDPSHASGRRTLIEPLSMAAYAAGLDGVMIEVHPSPDEARSDAAQAIDCAAFERIVRRIRRQSAA